MKLTANQIKGLELVHANPGKVLSGHNNTALRLNGHTERSLHGRGLIEAYNPATGADFHQEWNEVLRVHGEDAGDLFPDWYSGGYCWRLTDAGREALGLPAESADEAPKAVAPAAAVVHPLTGMTTYQLADYLEATITDGRLERITEYELRGLINYLQLQGHIGDADLQRYVDEAVAASQR